MKHNQNEFRYMEVPKKKIGNIVIIGIGVVAILITGFLYAAKLNKNAEIVYNTFSNPVEYFSFPPHTI